MTQLAKAAEQVGGQRYCGDVKAPQSVLLEASGRQRQHTRGDGNCSFSATAQVARAQLRSGLQVPPVLAGLGEVSARGWVDKAAAALREEAEKLLRSNRVLRALARRSGKEPEDLASSIALPATHPGGALGVMWGAGRGCRLPCHSPTFVPPPNYALADTSAWGGACTLRASAAVLGRDVIVLNNNSSGSSAVLYPSSLSTVQQIEFLPYPSSSTKVHPIGAYPRELFSPSTIVLLHDGDGAVDAGSHFDAAVLADFAATADDLLRKAEHAGIVVASAPYTGHCWA
jgi:hypothetical protein